MPSNWFILYNGKTIGPISADRLRQLADERKISRSTLIRSEKSDEWARADRLAGLFPEDPLLKVPTITAAVENNTSGNEVIYVEELEHNDQPRELPRTYCPFCAELIAVSARKCKHCGEFLDPGLRASTITDRRPTTVPLLSIDHKSSTPGPPSPSRADIPKPLKAEPKERSVSFYITSFVLGVLGVIIVIPILIANIVNVAASNSKKGSVAPSTKATAGREESVDDRVKWDSYSYQGIIEKQQDGTWIETDKNTGQLRHYLKETRRTTEYIELYNLKRNESYRLYPDHMEAIVNNQWTSIGAGTWVGSQQKFSANSTENSLANTSTSTDQQSQSSSSGGRVTIRRGNQGRIVIPGQESVWVAVDENAQSELTSFATKRNYEAIAQLMLRGEVFICPAGTRITVLQPGIFTYKIRIMEGDQSGRSGIVPSEWIHEL